MPGSHAHHHPLLSIPQQEIHQLYPRSSSNVTASLLFYLINIRHDSFPLQTPKALGQFSLDASYLLKMDSTLSLLGLCPTQNRVLHDRLSAAAAAAKALQSCPTLCDPIDGSPPGSPIPGILQARTLEWVAISFSNA